MAATTRQAAAKRAETKQTEAEQAERPASHSYEFGGPIGAFGISFGLPILMFLFTYGCNDVSGCPTPSLLHPSHLLETVTTPAGLEALKREVGWPASGLAGLMSWQATGWTLSYYLLSAVLHRVLPGPEGQGVELSSGGRLRYKFNALSSALFTLAICLAGTVAQGADFSAWTFMADNYVQILSANIVISMSLATYVYASSFSVVPVAKRQRGDLRELAAGGQTGSIIYDWYIGRELNPRVTLPLLGEIDIKSFMEVRPGLLGWALLNLSFVAKQYRTFGFVTDSIVFISAVQLLYVIDCLVMEPAILTTIDITTDGFGMMLSFGDLVWVPFMYSQQTRYLSRHPISLGWVGVVAMGIVLMTGFSIFRLANMQKNTFRTNPEDPRVAHLKYMETPTGSRLIVSGWWGIARHINYLGDWIQAWPYSLPTGLAGYVILAAEDAALAATTAEATGESVYTRADGRLVVGGPARGWGMVFTYFYILYFAILLVHRDLRDDEKCARKYGEAWERYKKIVRWHIVPGIY